MRERFDLNLANLDHLSMLIHGAYGAGKTHVQGDFLRWAQPQGPVAFLNIKGEDGHASLAGMGLGAIGDTVSTLDDYDQVMADYKSQKLVALAVDSLPAFYALILRHFVGSERYPDPKLDGERAKMLWGQIGLGIKSRVHLSREAARYVLWVAAYDRSEDIAGGKGITPDLPGKLAYGSAGWFDMVGYLTATTLGPNSVQRKLTFEPSSAFLTRQRLPQPLMKSIDLPQGGGGWKLVYEAIQATFQPMPIKESK